MKLQHKLLTVLLSLSMTIPTFATVKIEDTFKINNIRDTVSAFDTNKYIITCDNKIRGCGNSVLGINSTATNTNNEYKTIVTGVNGKTLDNIVKIDYMRYLYAIDNEGNAYYINGYPQKITIVDDSGQEVKFKDVAQSFKEYPSHNMTYLLSENGDLYRGNGVSYKKVTSVNNVKEIMTCPYSGGAYIHSLIVFIDESGQLYKEGPDDISPYKISGADGVLRAFNATNGIYMEFLSGKLGFLANGSSSVTTVNVPEDEIIYSMFGSEYHTFLVTNKNTYKVSNTSLTPVTLKNMTNDTDIKPATSSPASNIAINNDGDYYTWVLSGTEVQFTRIDGIDSWANDNPIVQDGELAKFDILPDEILKREDTKEIQFSLVSLKEPRKFNIYYSKGYEVGDKEDWTLVAENVNASDLYQEDFETGYINSDGEPITGRKYKYSWDIGTESLVSIKLIVEPIYNN